MPVPRAQVLITVPVLSLLGATEEPAMLDGYGPIPPSMARALVADGADSFYRVLIDPRDGAPLEIGRTSYRLTKGMRQWLRLRDGRCPFPGCNNPSLDNEADHLLAWADGGTTGITNLGQPCRKHHGLKHGSAWTPAGASKDKPPGWTSPSGRYYPSEQQDWEPPHWPPHILPRRRTDTDGQVCPRSRAGIPTWTCRRTPTGIPTWNCRRIPSRTGTHSRPGTPGPRQISTTKAGQRLPHAGACRGVASWRMPKGERIESLMPSFDGKPSDR